MVMKTENKILAPKDNISRLIALLSLVRTLLFFGAFYIYGVV